MKLEGRLFIANRMSEIKEVETPDNEGEAYSVRLERALVERLCG